MRHLLLDDRGGEGAHQVQHERGREVLGDLELQRVRVGRRDQGLDVVLVPAELGEQEGRRLVHQDDALQRPGHVVGGHRGAALELLVRAQLEGEGLGVRRDRPALGDAADQLVQVLGLVAHEPVIDVGAELLRRRSRRTSPGSKVMRSSISIAMTRVSIGVAACAAVIARASGATVAVSVA